LIDLKLDGEAAADLRSVSMFIISAERADGLGVDSTVIRFEHSREIERVGLECGFRTNNFEDEP
jgi:hypothetical protein